MSDPPGTLAEFLEAVVGLTADDATGIDTVLRDLAAAGLGITAESMVLNHIRRRTGMALRDLRPQFATFQRDLRPPADNQKPIPTAIRDRYVYVKSLNSCWDRQLRTFLPLEAIRNAHWSDMPPDDKGKALDPAAVFIRGELGDRLVVDKADSVTFRPLGSEIFEGALNIWDRPTLAPIEGDVAPFLDHLSYLFDGEREPMEWFLDWLAHLVQHPDQKMFSAVLIIGDPGIGKSIIARMMAPLLGRNNVATVERSNLLSQFNEWMDGAELVVVHELMMGGDRQEAMDRLKSYITEQEIRINRKNIPSYQYENRANFLMFSNRRDAALIERRDRRYFVWTCNCTPQINGYYPALMTWYEGNGAAALLHFLQHRDISHFHAEAAPPATAGKREVEEASRNPVEAYLWDAYSAGLPPLRHDLVIVNEIIDYLQKEKSIRAAHKTVTAFLRESCVGICLGQQRIYRGNNDPRKPRIWAIRDAAEWEQLGEDELRAAWRDIEDPALSPLEKNDALGRLKTV